ncbi:helix-turn-helix transcriptional regulator [Candidatus Gottesmanbacteria bacterium]|nr:helix-turn-helix transcriptional regulator [Candidatus Gottesmanbacteria bacterium]
MTQKELAKKTHTTQTVISRIENMSGNPTIDLLKRITQALGLHIRVNFG